MQPAPFKTQSEDQRHVVSQIYTKKHTCVIIRMCNVGIGVPMATVLYPVRRYFHIKYPGCKEQCYLVC